MSSEVRVIAADLDNAKRVLDVMVKLRFIVDLQPRAPGAAAAREQ